MQDSHGNMGNKSPFTTPQAVMQQVSQQTQMLEKDSPDNRYAGLVGILYGMATEINTLQTALADLQSKYNAHVHSGITAGAANSGAPTVTSNVSTGGAVTL